MDILLLIHLDIIILFVCLTHLFFFILVNNFVYMFRRFVHIFFVSLTHLFFFILVNNFIYLFQKYFIKDFDPMKTFNEYSNHKKKEGKKCKNNIFFLLPSNLYFPSFTFFIISSCVLPKKGG